MTQEQKELLLKDLCSRLPYGVKACVKNWSKLDRKYYEGIYDVKSVFPSLNEVHVQSKTGSVDVMLGYSDYEIKPYLFPYSSLTEEQIKEVHELSTLRVFPNVYLINWFLENHVDIYGFIEMGSAIDATGLNIY